MRIIKYFFGLVFTLAIVSGCKKDLFDDTSSIAGVAIPANLSALFNITQDNTGLVTITPNGEGASYYDIFYGDATTAPARVTFGKNTQHIYADGVYNVKMVAYNITGKTIETIQKLTVSFRAPENLEMTADIDPANNYKVTVTAKAIYQTLFKVYFGDVPNEVPVSFLQGSVVSHVYAATGTYTIKVVALSGGAATTQITKVINIVDPVLLPVTFESATVKQGQQY